MTEPSRRTFLGCAGRLAVVGVGTGVAGCASPLDGEPEPIDVTDAELDAIASIDAPSLPRSLPVDIVESRFETFRDRARSLLDAVPEQLAAEIPNEAVREHVTDHRESARERLATSDDESGYERLTTLASARTDAAGAEGAYAAAVGDRDREDVYAAVEPLRQRRADLETGLARVGETPQHAVIVYDVIESQLRRVTRRFETVDAMAPVASEVEAVGHAAPIVESCRASLDAAAHLRSRQNAAGDEAFDEPFETAAGELLAELRDRAETVPDDRDGVGDVFDAPVEDTPREWIADEVVRQRSLRDPERARERLEEGAVATALRQLYRIIHVLRTVDRLRSRIEEGAFERPGDAEPVRELKATAVDEFESVLADADHPWLARDGLRFASTTLHRGDRRITDSGYPPDTAAVASMGHYAMALEQVRATPATNRRFVDALRSPEQ